MRNEIRSPKLKELKHKGSERLIGGNSKVTPNEVLEAYPSKIEIHGGHNDVNRVLTAEGLDPIYEDEDETKHSTNLISNYGIQIQTNFGILQIIWYPKEKELRTTLRKTLTDRYPEWEHSVPDDENHRFEVFVGADLVGYVVIDADSYGEVEVYRSKQTHALLKKHHEDLGLKVKDEGKIELKEWRKEEEVRK